MGIFIGIVNEITLLNADLDDGDHLAYFFGVMKYFNGDKQINQKLRMQIEQFFDFKWKNDGLGAFDEEEELKLMSQLPEFVQNKLLLVFIFNNFI